MPGYISEFDYFGTSDLEFVEIAVPAGTDVSSYSLVLYQADGTIYKTVSLGTYTGTFAGQDVYVVDQSTPGFDSGGDLTGTFYPDDAIALVDDNGDVLQFISWEGNTVTAIEGPADGTTSTAVGFLDESLQSDDGGASYYAQDVANPGSIPACYAPGTLIDTPTGARPVERLRIGDLVCTIDNGPQPIRWVWDAPVHLPDQVKDKHPVLIRAGALGDGLPAQDLVVSAQHRILVGASGQLAEWFPTECLVPAKALTALPGIRHMRAKPASRWLHFSCERHELVRANGCLSESLYLGPMVLQSLPPLLRVRLSRQHRFDADTACANRPLARMCLTVGEAVNYLDGRGRTAQASRSDPSCPAPDGPARSTGRTPANAGKPTQS